MRPAAAAAACDRPQPPLATRLWARRRLVRPGQPRSRYPAGALHPGRCLRRPGPLCPGRQGGALCATACRRWGRSWEPQEGGCDAECPGSVRASQVPLKTVGVEAWGTRTSMERREESGRVELTGALMDRGRLGSERGARLAAQAFSGVMVPAGTSRRRSGETGDVLGSVCPGPVNTQLPPAPQLVGNWL